jgi:hypothetical protein
MQDHEFHPRWQWTLPGALGLLGFTLSLLVHVLSYEGIAATERVPAAWALHVGIFPLFFVLVYRFRRWAGTSRWQWWRQPGARELLRYFPGWVRVAVPLLFAYAMVNFLLATGVQPAANGSGTTLTPVATARAFSGHWLIFYLLPALFFSYVPAGARPTDAGSGDHAAA